MKWTVQYHTDPISIGKGGAATGLQPPVIQSMIMNTLIKTKDQEKGYMYWILFLS